MLHPIRRPVKPWRGTERRARATWRGGREEGKEGGKG